MRKFVFLFFLFANIFVYAQEVTPKLIRMVNSGYSAQLRGVSGTRTAGVTLTGSYKSNFKAHQFDVVLTGEYELWIDPAGGTNFSKDSGWSYSNGQLIAAPDLTDAAQFVSVVDSDKNDSLHAQHIEDSTITLNKFSTASLNFIGTGGSITNNPDDNTLENKGGSTIGIKESYLDSWIVANDTTDLKTQDGNVIVVKSAPLVEDIFHKVSSNDFSENGITVFSHPTSGFVWVRDDFVKDTTTFRTEWAGAKSASNFNKVVALMEAGDRILVEAGVWPTSTVTLTSANSPDSIEIRGGGRTNTEFGPLIINGRKGYSIRDMSFYQPSTANGLSFVSSDSTFDYGAFIENVEAHGVGLSTTHAILVQPGGGVTMDNIFVRDATHGIAYRARNGTITNVYADNVTNAIIVKSGIGTPDDGPNYNVIIDGVRVTNGGGVNVTATGLQTLHTVSVSNVVVFNGVYVVNCTVADGATPGYLYDIQINDCIGRNLTTTNAAYLNEGGSSVYFNNCISDSSNTYGFRSQVVAGRELNTYLNNTVSVRAATANYFGSDFSTSEVLNFYNNDFHEKSTSSTIGAQKDTLQTSSFRKVVYLFDDSSDEYVAFSFAPDTAKFRNNFFIDILWYSESATSGFANWGWGYSAIDIGGSTDVPTSGGTTYQSTETNGTTDRLNITTITKSTNILPKTGWIHSFVLRDGNGSSGTDDMVGDAVLLGVRIRY